MIDEQLRGHVRSQAVANVDARHRYTYEFSACPEAHLREYDEEEELLLAQLVCAFGGQNDGTLRVCCSAHGDVLCAYHYARTHFVETMPEWRGPGCNQRVHWGRQIDCVAQGCDPVHPDHHEVLPWQTDQRGKPDTSKDPVVSNHAARWVAQTVTYSRWLPIP